MAAQPVTALPTGCEPSTLDRRRGEAALRVVASPVVYTQIGDGPIRSELGLALIEGTSTHTLVSHLMRQARATACASGSVSATYSENVHGVTVCAAWAREEG